MILNTVGSSNGDNFIKITGNAVFVALLVVLLLAIAYYYVSLKSQPRPAYDVSDPVGKQSVGWSHPDLIPGLLFLTTFILLIAQTFKLSQTLVPVGTPALANVALIYIFSAVLNVIILIILTITWRPVFYYGLKDKQQALDRAQIEYNLVEHRAKLNNNYIYIYIYIYIYNQSEYALYTGLANFYWTNIEVALR
jgi:hypothetical protein